MACGMSVRKLAVADGRNVLTEGWIFYPADPGGAHAWTDHGGFPQKREPRDFGAMGIGS